MFSAFNLNRWSLSISAVAISVVGIFGSINTPAFAATITGPSKCGAKPEGQPISTFPKSAPKALATANQLAQNAGVKLTTWHTDQDVYELDGLKGTCRLEVDVYRNGQYQEVEQEITYATFKNAKVDGTSALNLLSKALDSKGLSPFNATIIEKSTRPDGVYYELDGTSKGKSYEVDIAPNGTVTIVLGND